MSRYVYDSGAVTIWQIKPCKSEINCDATLLFFLIRIRISSGQCTDQRSLAMIYMPGCTNDNMLHLIPPSCSSAHYNITRPLGTGFSGFFRFAKKTTKPRPQMVSFIC